MAVGDDMPYVDFLLLADRAEAINGKLYIMGGGWDRIQLPLPQFPAAYIVGLAIRVIVPPGDPRPDHAVALRIEGPGAPKLMPAGFRFERRGEAIDQQHSAIFGMQVLAELPEPGSYSIVAEIEGTERRTTFRVEAATG